MSEKIVDIRSRQHDADHKRKEQRLDKMKNRFEKALPTETHDPKEKLLNIFRKKPKK